MKKPKPRASKPKRVPDDYSRVFNLTGTQYGISNIALKRLKVARFSELNDPFELLSVDRSDVKDRADVRKKTQEINEQKGLICFVRSWENPVMWGHYADRHSGICLGFDVPETKLRDVEYKASLRRVTRNPKTGEAKLNKVDIELLMRTKFKDWEYERETRLFIDLEELKSEGSKYFLPFSADLKLREVILGPRCEIGIDGIRNLVGSDVVVSKARLAFRSFKVVPHKRASKAK